MDTVNIVRALAQARKLEPVQCPVCFEDRLFAPLTKLRIALNAMCEPCLGPDEDEYKINNLFKLVNHL